MVQYGPAEPSLRAHRIARFRSHPWLCWDLLSLLELQGRAGCRRCVHLLGKRNGYHSQFKWADAVGGLNSLLTHLSWPSEFRKRRGRLVPDACSFTLRPTKTRPLLSARERFDQRGERPHHSRC